ncbi:MAG TPA: isoprenylcysteine carboxylmethyltransferase family protein [Mycobacterium sp.]|nr:isoprenylcysteine carboxylmethyltransferase family protein [Mycobacterium sp.]
MAALATVLVGVFAAIGMGWRSWLQHRRTGSTGFRVFHGRIGSPEWCAVAAFSTAQATLTAGPILQWTGVVRPVAVLQVTGIQVTGIVLAVAGMAATSYAQLAMGDSWRIGTDRYEQTTLVSTGVFGRVRNPIFSAMLIFSLGIALLTPNAVTLVGLGLLVGSIQLTVRLVEEPHLRRIHGDDYRSYTSRVGRFIPGVGRCP